MARLAAGLFAASWLIAACISGERRATPSADAQGGDADAGCGADACTTGLGCVPAGSPEPGGVCSVCDPSVRSDGWTAASEGTPCADDDGCTVATQCHDGRCEGELDPLCVDPPACVTDVACSATGCEPQLSPGTCLIAGACYAEGVARPGQPCQRCASAVDPRAWSAAPVGPCDDGDPCTEGDACGAGVCAGTALDCDDGVACTADDCDGGVCAHEVTLGACFIAEGCYLDGQGAPEAACQVCDADSPRAWTAVTAGGCDDGDACTSADRCEAGACVGHRVHADPEPNDAPTSAASLGTAGLDATAPFPTGTQPGTLNPASEVDWFAFALDFGGAADRRRPRVRLRELDSATAYEICLFARCGLSDVFSVPQVSCAGDAVELPGSFLGCCATLSAGLEEATMNLNAMCTGPAGTASYGVVRARVRAANAGASGCPGYTLDWGVSSD